MADADPNVIVRQHLRRYFAGHACNEFAWSLGPALEELPRLRVAEFAPGPKSALWVYATVGAWESHPERLLEFIIAAPAQDLRHVELLSMAAWNHGRHGLGIGHTLPIGEPWLPESECEFFLVSHPYPFGPDLEVCNVTDSHLHVVWLLPITASEREYKMREGLETLEQRFDACALEFWVPWRTSVV